mmetsp:Transcript_31531/g.61747  ORF Transcript_31531/g.61747 Transcript_31531/m.61747 type:complete len:685 (-) Transcript_31531:99-2153(-)
MSVQWFQRIVYGILVGLALFYVEVARFLSRNHGTATVVVNPFNASDPRGYVTGGVILHPNTSTDGGRTILKGKSKGRMHDAEIYQVAPVDEQPARYPLMPTLAPTRIVTEAENRFIPSAMPTKEKRGVERQRKDTPAGSNPPTLNIAPTSSPTAAESTLPGMELTSAMLGPNQTAVPIEHDHRATVSEPSTFAPTSRLPGITDGSSVTGGAQLAAPTREPTVVPLNTSPTTMPLRSRKTVKQRISRPSRVRRTKRPTSKPTFKPTRSPTESGKAKFQYRAIGMFNSGTNLLDELGWLNFDHDLDESHFKEEKEFWKHTPPMKKAYGGYQERLDDELRSLAATNVTVIAMVRNPFAHMAGWLKSPYAIGSCAAGTWTRILANRCEMREHMGAETIENTSMPKRRKIVVTFPRPGIVNVWNEYVRGYLELASKHDNMMILRYEDLVLDTELAFQTITNFAGVPMPEQFIMMNDAAKRHGKPVNSSVAAAKILSHSYLYAKTSKGMDGVRGSICKALDMEALDMIPRLSERVPAYDSDCPSESEIASASVASAANGTALVPSNGSSLVPASGSSIPLVNGSSVHPANSSVVPSTDTSFVPSNGSSITPDNGEDHYNVDRNEDNKREDEREKRSEEEGTNVNAVRSTAPSMAPFTVQSIAPSIAPLMAISRTQSESSESRDSRNASWS